MKRELRKRTAPVAGMLLILSQFLILAAGVQAEGKPVETAGGRLLMDRSLIKMFTHSDSFSAAALPQGIHETAEAIAAEHGIPGKLVRSIIRAESNGDPGAVSPKGAMGLMQLMAPTAREQQVSNPFDPVANIRGGVRYLKTLLQEFSGNVPLALAAYNAGPGAVRRHQGFPPFPETREFVRKVTEDYERSPDARPGRSFPAVPVRTEVQGRIIFTGSPRELAAFLNRAK